MPISIIKAVELANKKGGSVENWTSSDDGVGGAWLVKYDGEGFLFNKSTTTLMQAMLYAKDIQGCFYTEFEGGLLPKKPCLTLLAALNHPYGNIKINGVSLQDKLRQAQAL